MNMIEALTGLDELMIRDVNALSSRDVAGGVFRVTDGLQEKHGAHRVFDTTCRRWYRLYGNGHGPNGLRPVAEIQFADYIFPAYDQIVNEIAKIDTAPEENFDAVTEPCRRGHPRRYHHSQSPEAQFTHTCLWYTVNTKEC